MDSPTTRPSRSVPPTTSRMMFRTGCFSKLVRTTLIFTAKLSTPLRHLDGFLKPLDYFCNGNILAGRRRARHQLQPPFCRFLAYIDSVGYSDQVRIFKFDASPLIPVIQ